MAKRRKSKLTILALLLSALLIATASAAIYYQITASMTFEVGWSPVVFTEGEDTSTCGGTPISNNASISFSGIPLAIGSNITITQLVNVTNSDGASSHDVNVTVSSENFNGSLSILLLYLVSPSGSETLVVKIDGSGDVVTQGVEETIPISEEWAIKLVGCYDTGTGESITNTITLNLEVK